MEGKKRPEETEEFEELPDEIPPEDIDAAKEAIKEESFGELIGKKEIEIPETDIELPDESGAEIGPDIEWDIEYDADQDPDQDPEYDY